MAKTKSKQAFIGVRCPADMADKIDLIAAKYQTKRSAVVRMAVVDMLAKHAAGK